MYVCRVMACRSGWFLFPSHGMYHEQHLRRDDHRRQDRAPRESILRYVHQGGGQRHAGQRRVSYKRIIQVDKSGTHF